MFNDTFANWRMPSQLQIVQKGGAEISSLYYYCGLFLCVILGIVVVVTRITSDIQGRSRWQSDNGASTVPLLPYWLPFLGHIPELILRPEKLLKGNRDHGPHNIFALNLGGSTHNMIWSPRMAQSVFAQRPSVVDFDSLIWFFVNTVGGVPTKFREHYGVATKPLTVAVTSHMLREPSLGKMVGVTIRNVEENLPNLVSFAKSVVDQSLWERSSGAKLVSLPDQEPVMEVSLLPLITDFIAHQAIPSLFGTDLLRTTPTLLQDLWSFNSGFLLLAIGLPPWLPIPPLRRAHQARNRIREALAAQQRALDAEAAGKDPGPGWRSLDDVSALLRDRRDVYAQHGIPPEGRSELSILWATNANSNFLVFWMLVRILAMPELAERLRAESAPYIKLSAPSQDFGGMAEPPRLKIDEKGLVSSCPLLKSCFIECLRLDNAPWSLKKVLKDFTVASNDDDVASREKSMVQQQHHHVLKAGTFVDVAFDLHFTDPSFFPSPSAWIPDRHIVPTGTAEWGTVRPFGGGSTMCKGRLFAEKEVLAVVAALLAGWEFEAVGDKEWKVPRGRKATAVVMPVGDFRVRVRRRGSCGL